MAFRFTGSSALPVLGASAAADRNPGSDLVGEVVSLFGQFRNPLLRYLSGFGLTFCDGEDVIQEVFLSLFHHLQCGKSRSNLRGWLFRVAHNLALKRKYQMRQGPALWSGTELSEDMAVDPALNPEDKLVKDHKREVLLAVARALPEQDRRCLSLRAEGLRYREIAEILDISLGAVSLSLARSLARIARAAER
jgi:RNA polymerase sigma-70 factor (ECF subfamily)